jgi:hypothetical protein
MQAAIVFSLIVGSVFGTIVLLILNSRLHWYVPAVTHAKLSRELGTQVAIVEAIATRMQTTIDSLERVEKLVEDIEFSRELITTVLEAQASKQLQAIHPDVINYIIREVSPYVAHQLTDALRTPVVSLGSQYVVLKQIDECRIDVQLSPKHYSVKELRDAIARVLEYQPRKLPKVVDDRTRIEWLLESTKSDREMELFLGSLGEALFNLRWEGTVALKSGRVA